MLCVLEPMTKIKGAIYGIGLFIIVAWLYRYQYRRDAVLDVAAAARALPVEDKEKIIVDYKTHTLTEVTEGIHGTVEHRIFLPARASIEVRKDGGVKVTARSYGTTVSPYVGLAVSAAPSLRVALGVNLAYWQRWELGGGLLMNSNIHDTRLFVGGTYNAYENIIVGVAIDNKRTAHVLVGLKF